MHVEEATKDAQKIYILVQVELAQTSVTKKLYRNRRNKFGLFLLGL